MLKKLIFAMLPLLALVLLAELIAGRALLYSTTGSVAATGTAIDAARNWLHRSKGTGRREFAFRGHGPRYPESWERLYSGDAPELLAEVQAKYRSRFEDLLEACEDDGVELIVLYMPSTDPADPSKHVSEAVCRPWFRDLASDYDLPFIDATDALHEYAWTDVTLMPLDGHLSRLGCRIVADVVAPRIAEHRSPLVYDPSARPFGDLEPNLFESRDDKACYLVTANAQGFRAYEDLDPVKDRQRVLMLGDSFTFGLLLNYHNSFPAQIQARRPDLEVINAGISAYTIDDQASLYIERARHAAPDVVVLQVLDNDLKGMLAYMRNAFDRRGLHHEPSDLERAFIESLESDTPRHAAASGG